MTNADVPGESSTGDEPPVPPARPAEAANHPAPATEPGQVRPTGRPNARLRQSVADMVRSLALVLGVVAVVVIFAFRPQPEAVKVIDPGPELSLARAQADYPVLYPAALPDGWRPTSARWQPTEASAPEPAWHVGYVTPGDAYAQVGQSATTSPRYVVEQTAQGRIVDTTGEWQRYDNGKDRRSLVAIRSGITIVVSGTAEWDVLIDLADRLSPTAVP